MYVPVTAPVFQKQHWVFRGRMPQNFGAPCFCLSLRCCVKCVVQDGRRAGILRNQLSVHTGRVSEKYDSMQCCGSGPGASIISWSLGSWSGSLLCIYQRDQHNYRKMSIFCYPITVLVKYSNSFSVSVADSGCSSQNRIFPSRIPDPGSKIFPETGSISKILGILTQKIVSQLSEIWSEMFIPDPGSGSWFFTHPGCRT